MGDKRFDQPYERLRGARDRAAAISRLGDAEVILALGGAAREGDRYLANVLVTEALNRQRRLAAIFVAVTLGSLFFVVSRVTLTFVFASPSTDLPERLRVVATLGLLLGGAVIAILTYLRARRHGLRLGV